MLNNCNSICIAVLPENKYLLRATVSFLNLFSLGWQHLSSILTYCFVFYSIVSSVFLSILTQESMPGELDPGLYWFCSQKSPQCSHDQSLCASCQSWLFQLLVAFPEISHSVSACRKYHAFTCYFHVLSFFCLFLTYLSTTYPHSPFLPFSFIPPELEEK